MRRRAFLTAFALVATACAARAVNAESRGLRYPAEARHIVLIVCDGLRPDSVTEATMPTLSRLGREGVVFARNHCVYPTSTEVNGTVFATGVFPGGNGIVANKEYRPAANPRRAIPTESREAMRSGDRCGRYLAAATLAEQIQTAGFSTAIAGTKPVVLLHDRSETRATETSRNSSLISKGDVFPSLLKNAIEEAQGPFPRLAFPNTDQDRWTTRALVEQAWREEVPRFSLLWLSDPDFSQHQTAPGSETALAALKSADDQIAAVLAALEAKGVREQTDLFVVSDHGFSTQGSIPDLAERLQQHGFDATSELGAEGLTPGRILVVPLGGTVSFYVAGHDPALTARLAERLQSFPEAGVVITRRKLPGTFTLKDLRVNTPDAPDLFLSYRWDASSNAYGVPGAILSGTASNFSKGSHASLSRFDLHNTLIAAGPDLKRGEVNQRPTGNIDLAATILALLGIPPAQPLDGRVLIEALRPPPGQPSGKLKRKPAADPETVTLRARHRLDEVGMEGMVWRQVIKFTRFGGSLYFEEGNGAQQKAQP
jgi:arylsulfatase A-like enzyme